MYRPVGIRAGKSVEEWGWVSAGLGETREFILRLFTIEMLLQRYKQLNVRVWNFRGG